MVVCDQAHKYFDQRGNYGLAASVVETVRLMRHEGMRVVVSTQSPTTMPQELLELSTITVLHRFHSLDWWKYLSLKNSAPGQWLSEHPGMLPGMALIFAQGTALKRSLRRRAYYNDDGGLGVKEGGGRGGGDGRCCGRGFCSMHSRSDNQGIFGKSRLNECGASNSNE